MHYVLFENLLPCMHIYFGSLTSTLFLCVLTAFSACIVACMNVLGFRFTDFNKIMKPDEIEQLLSQLENGEISDDGGSEDEDEIDYYVNREQIQQELEYAEDLAADAAGAGNEENTDPPLLNDCDNETTDTNQSVPLVNYTGTLRGIVWKVKKMNLLEEAFNFKGNTEYLPTNDYGLGNTVSILFVFS